MYSAKSAISAISGTRDLGGRREGEDDRRTCPRRACALMNTNTAATHTPATTASGSTPAGKTAAAAAAMVTGPAGATTSAPLQRTPGFEQLNDDQVLAAFMGSPSGAADETGGKKGDAKGEEGKETGDGDGASDGEGTGEGEGEGQGSASSEAEDEGTGTGDGEGASDGEGDDKGKVSDLDKGLDNALKDHPGLRKRVKSLMAEHPKLKREIAELKTQLETKVAEPEMVLPEAAAGNPLAVATTEAKLEAMATEIQVDARTKLRWLNRNTEGGVWKQGDKEVTLTAEQVEEAIEHYERTLEGLEGHKSARKAWLKTYGETVKEIGADQVTDLLKPKVATRESVVLAKVPELMREADFIRLLADAKAGREMREKKAGGVTFVEVKAGGKKEEDPKGKGKEGGGSTPAGTGKPAPKQEQPRKVEALTQDALAKLRTDAAAGKQEAKDKLLEQFLAG